MSVKTCIIPNFTKEKAIDLIKKAKRIMGFHDDKWHYITQRDTPDKKPMLEMLFKIEQTPGVIIFIPMDEEKVRALNKRIPPFGHDDVNGK